MGPVIINNSELRKTFHHVMTMQIALEKEFSQVEYNKHHLDKLVPEFLVQTYSSKRDTALRFTDEVIRAAYEAGVILLVATFENVLFSKYRTSYGSLRVIVRDNSTRPLDYFDARERFINASIDKLHTILELFKGFIDDDLFNRLSCIKDHRNYIAHGKRDFAAPAAEYLLEEIAKTLDDVVSEVER